MSLVLECESEGLSTAQLSRLKYIANVSSKINMLLQNSMPQVTNLMLLGVMVSRLEVLGLPELCSVIYSAQIVLFLIGLGIWMKTFAACYKSHANNARSCNSLLLLSYVNRCNSKDQCCSFFFFRIEM